MLLSVVCMQHIKIIIRCILIITLIILNIYNCNFDYACISHKVVHCSSSMIMGLHRVVLHQNNNHLPSILTIKSLFLLTGNFNNYNIYKMLDIKYFKYYIQPTQL